jgi:peptide/nickel transport system permease protein
VLPNSAGTVISVAALEFGTAVLAVSALSFLGYGAPAPSPEWGRLVSEGRDFMATAWWLVTFSGVVIALLVLAANRVARALEKGGRQ